MKKINITETKLRETLQIVLGGKGIYTYDLEKELVKEIKAFDMHIVMPMLLFIEDNVDTYALTKGKKYKTIFIKDEIYVIKDDKDDILGYHKLFFEVIEAQ